MKPNRFITNSDYLALAQTSQHSEHVLFPETPHEYIPSVGIYQPAQRVIKNISMPAVKGAIEQIQIEYMGVTYAGNELLNPITNNEQWALQVIRLDANTIQATFVHLVLGSPTVQSMTPEIEFDFNITTFRPPNIT